MKRFSILKEKDFLFLTSEEQSFQDEYSFIITEFVSSLEEEMLILFCLKPCIKHIESFKNPLTFLNVFRINLKFKKEKNIENKESETIKKTLMHTNILTKNGWKIFLTNTKMSRTESKKDFYIYACTEEETNFIIESYCNIFEKSDLSGLLSIVFDKDFIPMYNPKTFKNW
jgi:hypothetical protein